MKNQCNNPDMRYENPLYMAEDAGAADLISGGRLQLGISRGSPEQVIDGWRHFGFAPAAGESDADMGRRHTERLLEVLTGEGFAAPSPRLPPGLLRVEPHSGGLRERIYWGSGSNATAVWAAKLGMNLQSSTLKDDESGKPFHVQQAEQIELYRQAWKEAGHEREPRVSVSRSIFALTDERDWQYFGRDRHSSDQVGNIDEKTRAVFGRSYAGAPDELAAKLAEDEAIATADTLLLTVPNHTLRTPVGKLRRDPEAWRELALHVRRNILAAQLRVALDATRGRPTPEAVKRLAQMELPSLR